MSGLHIQHKTDLHIVRWAVALIIIGLIVGVSYFGVRWYNTGIAPPFPIPVASADSSINETPVTKAQVAAYNVPASNPRYISIPSLNINQTRITKVGIDKNNMLGVPGTLDDTGWYEKSAKPGDGYGAVMIDGHNGGVSRDGVFAKIDTLKPGDEITVERGDGKKFTYEVHDVRIMSLSEANKTGMKEMMSSAMSDLEGLSLITCAGNWVPKDKVFDKRVMLRATLVE